MSRKKRIVIYILIAAAVVILGALAIFFAPKNNAPASAQDRLDLGNVYLIDLSYEKAVIEFTEAIEIEPMNSEAYLGLAKAYIGLGETEKAVEALENGLTKTGDNRLVELLDEINPPAATTVTTAAATTVTTAAETTVTTAAETTVTTAEMLIVPDLSGLTQKEAIAACEAEGLRYNISTAESDTVEKGYVISQAIPAKAEVALTAVLNFNVSEGKSVVTTAATKPKAEYITIKGEKYSTELTELDLYGRGLTNDDIKELSKMTNLTYLDLGENQISDISALKVLTNLTYLEMFANQISDISALKGLTNLTYLGLRENQIIDISALKGLTKLETLYLGVNQISDISALKGLTNLTFLDLWWNQISDISALKGLTKLVVLWLDGNQISDEDIEELKKSLPDCSIRG